MVFYIQLFANSASEAITNGRVQKDAYLPAGARPLAHPSDVGDTIDPSMGPSKMLESGSFSTPQSPYSANRALLRDLTLPTVLNLDIPASPPGSPPPGLDQKLAHFLELKRQGIHFNEKLAQSSALKNPTLLKKLIGFAGLEETQQYTTTLPKDIWDPNGFPTSAFKEELAKSQQEILKKREEEHAMAQRENIEFVSASASGQSSRAGTPASTLSSKALRGSAAERVMAGLDRDRTQSPRMSELVARGTINQKTGRNNDGDSRWKARSRLPNEHRRSRSR